VLTWFRELEWYGFIRMVSPAHHGVKHGKALHWRLTEVDHAGRSPTRDYLNWNETVFPKKKRTGEYRGKNRIRGAHVDTRVVHTWVPVSAQNGSANIKSGAHVGAIPNHEDGAHVESITSLTAPYADKASTGPLSSPALIALQRQRLNDLSARLAAFAPIRVPAETELDRVERS
jgi:hypothetical protein